MSLSTNAEKAPEDPQIRAAWINHRGVIVTAAIGAMTTLISSIITAIATITVTKDPGSPPAPTPTVTVSTTPPLLAPTPAPTGDSYQDNSTEKKVTAKVACDRFVEKKLKAPATARYADYTDAEVTYQPLNKTYTVTTYVDSQNGFSATLRTHYVCTVTTTDRGETWKVIDLDVKE